MTSHAIPGTTVPARTRKTARLEGAVLVLILLAVGGAAGAASFTHVHDWTMHNSPSSTGDWFGWANAVITELVPIAALLVMRRRRAAGQPIAYPTALLGAALVLSVTAQLAVAKPGFSGGLVSVIPALAFAALAKLVLGKTPAPEPEPAPQVVPDRPHDRPQPVPAPLTTPAPIVATPSVQEFRPVPAEAVPVASPAVPGAEDDADDVEDVDQVVTAELVTRARQEAAAYLKATGRSITRDELRARLRVANGTAGELLRHLRTAATPAPARGGLGPLTVAARPDSDRAAANGHQAVAAL
ncbi:hypothetical protein CS0771_11920 [Catellatospora sp. IY07-71]|uniref:hypothetical protein n=1 Tax=Catellatospora sp. IY07-71 TaxID=2728827 RepID=UPI001BB7DAF6|nr:hypothetical protein CS0771_11920 [Catellatospora sp. IY07-71]